MIIAKAWRNAMTAAARNPFRSDASASVDPMTRAERLTVRVKRLPHGKDLELPKYETALAAGCDVRAAVPEDQPLTLKPGERAMVPTGIAIALPPGWEAQMRARS